MCRKRATKSYRVNRPLAFSADFNTKRSARNKAFVYCFAFSNFRIKINYCIVEFNGTVTGDRYRC